MFELGHRILEQHLPGDDYTDADGRYAITGLLLVHTVL